MIGIPGIKDKFEGRSDELLSDWLGEDAHMFKSPGRWKEIIDNNDRILSLRTWEMECFDAAWSEWLKMDNEFANDDKKYFNPIIKPYTCFVGIEVKLR